MEILNLSAEPLGRLYSWMPHDLDAVRIVALPDACPGKSPLPTGTAALTYQEDWRRFAISDCGCGMQLLRSQRSAEEIEPDAWDALADLLRNNKGGLGDLGGGNHFLDALRPLSGGPVHFLIHTGSRAESGIVDHLVDDPSAFDAELERVTRWARENRLAVARSITSLFGPLELLLDLPHNTVERLGDGGVIIRKGSVRIEPGDINVIPSHMSGDVVVVQGTDRVRETLCSLSHGTGRIMARGDCKPLAERYDFRELRSRVIIPTTVTDASLRTEGPYAYRDLDECLMLLDECVEVQERFNVLAYMGHL